MSYNVSSYNDTDLYILSFGVPPEDLYLFYDPNYVHPPMKGTFLVPLVAVLLGITWTVVPLRLYSRKKVLKSWAPDDWLIIPATLAATSVSIITILSATYGMGKHFYDVPFNNWEPLYLVLWIFGWNFTITIALAKFSMLLFYRRFANTKWFTITIWFMMGYTLIWMVTYFIIAFISCKPIQFNWTGDGTCWDADAAEVVYFTHAGFNALGDLIILVLPLPTVIQMNLPLKQKAGLLGVFLLGSLVTVAGSARVVYLVRITVGNGWDITWSNYDLVAATNIEIHVALFCSSAPILKPLFKQAITLVSPLGSRKTESEVSDNIPLSNVDAKGAAIQRVTSEPKSYDEEVADMEHRGVHVS